MITRVKDGIINFTKQNYLMSLLSTYIDMFAFSTVLSIIIVPVVFVFAFGLFLSIGMMATDESLTIVGILLTILIYALLFVVIMFLSMFGMGVMITSLTNAFMNAKQKGKIEISDLFTIFKVNWKNVIKVHLKKATIVTLWSLLLYVPGIIKYLELFMVDMILAENPNIDVNEVMNLSRQITNGEKLNIFVVTFILGIIVSAGTIVFGVGQIFLIPILYIGYVEIYEYLKEKAYNIGIQI